MNHFHNVVFGILLTVCLSCGEVTDPQIGGPGNPTPNPSTNPAFPESVTLEGKLDGEPTLITNRGGVGSGAIYVLKGKSSNITLSPSSLSSQLNLAQASKKEYVSPTLGDCGLEIQTLGATPGNRAVSFELWTAHESDAAAPPYCYLFVNEVKANGITIKFTNVPTYGGMGTVKSVTVKLTK